MVGGKDDDSYEVENTGDVVVELAGEGFDAVFATKIASYTLSDNVEMLQFRDAIAHIGVGNDGVNWLFGNSGKDTLIGRGGNDHLDGAGGGDQLIGGTGDDGYIVRPGDSVLELANEGIDTIHTGISFYQLPDNVENLDMQGDVGFGNGADNGLSGNWVQLYGLGGNDTHALRHGRQPARWR